jgi:hypothetical protein
MESEGAPKKIPDAQGSNGDQLGIGSSPITLRGCNLRPVATGVAT